MGEEGVTTRGPPGFREDTNPSTEPWRRQDP